MKEECHAMEALEGCARVGPKAKTRQTLEIFGEAEGRAGNFQWRTYMAHQH